MAKASDNEFPSVLFAEQSSDPATPSAGTARLFVNNAATPELELIDDSGTVTTFGSGGGSGSPGFDEIFNSSNRSGSAFVREFSSGESEDSTTVEDTSPNITKTKSNDKLSILDPGGDSSAELHAVMWSYAPAGDFYLDCAVRTLALRTGPAILGPIAADGATYGAGTQVFAGPTLLESTAGTNVGVRKMTGYNTASTTAGFSSRLFVPASSLLYLRLHRSSTSWTSWISTDGISWVKSAALTQSLTVSHVGFALSSWGGSGPVVCSVEYVAAYTGTSSDPSVTI